MATSGSWTSSSSGFWSHLPAQSAFGYLTGQCLVFFLILSVAAFPSKWYRAWKAALMVRRSISACWVFPAEKTRPLIATKVLNPAPILLYGCLVRERQIWQIYRECLDFLNFEWNQRHLIFISIPAPPLGTSTWELPPGRPLTRKGWTLGLLRHFFVIMIHIIVMLH